MGGSVGLCVCILIFLLHLWSGISAHVPLFLRAFCSNKIKIISLSLSLSLLSDFTSALSDNPYRNKISKRVRKLLLQPSCPCIMSFHLYYRVKMRGHRCGDGFRDQVDDRSGLRIVIHLWAIQSWLLPLTKYNHPLLFFMYTSSKLLPTSLIT